MLIRTVVVASLCCGVGLSGAVQAQGELSQCQSAKKERLYPCRISGVVVRSNRDHQVQERAIEQTGRSLDQSVLDQRGGRDVLVRDVLRLLLD